jgi:hypothetical protein
MTSFIFGRKGTPKKKEEIERQKVILILGGDKTGKTNLVYRHVLNCFDLDENEKLKFLIFGDEAKERDIETKKRQEEERKEMDKLYQRLEGKEGTEEIEKYSSEMKEIQEEKLKIEKNLLEIQTEKQKVEENLKMELEKEKTIPTKDRVLDLQNQFQTIQKENNEDNYTTEEEENTNETDENSLAFTPINNDLKEKITFEKQSMELTVEQEEVIKERDYLKKLAKALSDDRSRLISENDELRKRMKYFEWMYREVSRILTIKQLYDDGEEVNFDILEIKNDLNERSKRIPNKLINDSVFNTKLDEIKKEEIDSLKREENEIENTKTNTEEKRKSEESSNLDYISETLNNGENTENVKSEADNISKSSSITDIEQLILSDTLKVFLEGIDKFNESFKHGLEYLYSKDILEKHPMAIAKFFLTMLPLLDQRQIGQYFGKVDEIAIHCFTDLVIGKILKGIKFYKTGVTFENALRIFLSLFILPSEGQQVSRICEMFSISYCQHNPGVLQDPDNSVLLTASILMLNTDLYNSKVKTKIQKEQFYAILSSTKFSKDFLSTIYDNIKESELKLAKAELKSMKDVSLSGNKSLKKGMNIQELKKKYDDQNNIIKLTCILENKPISYIIKDLSSEYAKIGSNLEQEIIQSDVIIVTFSLSDPQSLGVSKLLIGHILSISKNIRLNQTNEVQSNYLNKN